MTYTDVRDITSFKWATVKGISPLSIQLDGDTVPLALIPDSLVDPLSLSIGNRVRVEMSLRKVVVHGKSNGVALPEPTLVKIVPASVGANAVINADGSVSFTSCADVILEDIFSTEYRNYRLLMVVDSLSAAASLFARLRDAGSTITTALYQTARNYNVANVPTSVATANAARFEIVGGTALHHSLDLLITNPAHAIRTLIKGSSESYNASNQIIASTGAGLYDAATVADSLSIIPASGTITGILSIYAFN